MTPHFSRFSKRLTTLKWIFISSIVIAVFGLTTSFYVGFQYFVQKRGLLQEQWTHLERLEKLDALTETLQNAEAHFADQYHEQKNVKAAELNLLARIDTWEKIRNLTQDAALTDTTFHAGEVVTSVTAATSTLQNLQSLVRSEKKRLLSQLKFLTSSMNTTQKDALIVGLIVLIFGFFVPYFILKIAVKLTNQLRLHLEKTAYDVMKTWSEERSKYGEDAFKNVEFWLRIVLVVGQHSGRMSSHPVPQMLGELAYLVQIELSRLEKERKTNPA